MYGRHSDLRHLKLQKSFGNHRWGLSKGGPYKLTLVHNFICLITKIMLISYRLLLRPNQQWLLIRRNCQNVPAICLMSEYICTQNSARWLKNGKNGQIA